MARELERDEAHRTVWIAKYRLDIRDLWQDIRDLARSPEPADFCRGCFCISSTPLEESVLAAEAEVATDHKLSAQGQSLLSELKPTFMAGYSLELSFLPFHGSDSTDWKAESLFILQPDQFFIAK